MADKIRKRVDWLNEHCFADRPIDDDAVAAMVAVGVKKAMELFKELEERKEEMKKPSGFLCSAARKEGFGPAGDKGKGGGKGDKKHNKKPGQHQQQQQQPEATNAAVKIAKRVAWLNEHHFAARKIDEQSVAALVGMGIKTSMEVLKELEEKKEEVKKPSHFIKSWAKREGFAPPDSGSSHHGGKGGKGGKGDKKGGGGGGENAGGAGSKIQNRAQWLNDKFFAANPIDADAVAAMVGMGKNRAFELFKELESKVPHNPSGYLKAAARREGFGPPDDIAPLPKGQGKGHHHHAGKGKGKHSGTATAMGGKGGALGAALALVGGAGGGSGKGGQGSGGANKGAGKKGGSFSSTPAPLVGVAHKGGQKGGQKGQGKASGSKGGLPKPPMPPTEQGQKRPLTFQSNHAGAPQQKRLRLA